jgi:hypothetical protein
MAQGWVMVVGAPGRNVYLNGDFAHPCGITNIPIAVDIGRHTFSLLGPGRAIEAEATLLVHVATRSEPVRVELAGLPAIDAL